MSATRAILAAMMATALAGQALAAENSDSTVVRGLVIQGRLSTVVQGLIVTPSRVCLKPHSPPDPDVPAPKLVSSFPANGSVVKPGILVLRLTFDLPMTCAGLIEPAVLTANPCPAPLADPVISKDRRTIMTVCVVDPSVQYGIWLNRPSSQAPHWTNLAGHELASRQILFTTSSGGRAPSLHDAIAEDPVLQAMVGPTAEDASSAVFTGQASAAAPAAESPRPMILNGVVIKEHLSDEALGLNVTHARDCLRAQKPADPAVPPPELVSSFPAVGAEVKPGIVVVRFTFNQPMACPGPIDDDSPLISPCRRPPIDAVISADRRTFLAICVVDSNSQYGMWLNRGRDRRSLSGNEAMTVSASQHPVQRWTSLAGHLLGPQEITFTTSNGDRILTVRDAIAEDPVLRAIVGQKPGVASPEAAAAAPPGR